MPVTDLAPRNPLIRIRLRIYKRISDDREGLALGVQRQDTDVRRLAEQLNAVIVGVYEDNDIGASTRSKKKRPDYARLLKDAQNDPGSYIAAYTSARLTRRPLELEGQIQLAERFQIRFVYVASPSFDLNTADGRQIARMLAAQDAGESERMSERIIRAKLESAIKGERSGGSRPFGWERGGMVQRPDEVKLIKDGIDVAMALEKSKRKSLGFLAREWTKKCPPTSWDSSKVEAMAKRNPNEADSPEEAALILDAVERAWLLDQSFKEIMHDWVDHRVPIPGATWSTQAVKGILIAPRNAGLIVKNGKVVSKSKSPGFITEETWRAVTAVLTDESRRTNYNGSSLRWVGSGMYACGKEGCTSAARPASQTYKAKGTRYPLYRCAAGSHLTIAAEVVDAKVTTFVVELLRREGVGLLARTPGVDLEGLRERANTLRARRQAAADAYAREELDLDDWIPVSRELKEKLQAVELELARLTSGSVLEGVADAEDPGAAFLAIEDLGKRRAIIGELVAVTLLPASAVKGVGGTRAERTLRRVQLAPAFKPLAETASTR